MPKEEFAIMAETVKGTVLYDLSLKIPFYNFVSLKFSDDYQQREFLCSVLYKKIS